MSHIVQISPQTAKIRALNDELRTDPSRMLAAGLCQTVATSTLLAKGPAFVDRAWNATRTFSNFTPDNDPYGEHDCAVMTIGGEAVIWKIDYFAPDWQHGSDDPSDERKTRRVLTLMLAQDY